MITIDSNFANKAAVLASISKLTQEADFDDIAISEICREACISKTTFYRLFANKYEVVEWLMATYSSVGLDQIGRTKNFHDGIAYSVFNLANHRQFLLSANRTKKLFDQPAEFAYRHRAEALQETVTQWKKAPLTLRLQYQIDEWAYSSTHIAAKWYRSEIDCTKDEYVDILESMVPQELYSLLNEPAEPNTTRKGLPSSNDIEKMALCMLQSATT